MAEDPPRWCIISSKITDAHPPQDLEEVDVAMRSRFTRIPKVSDLVLAGVPTEVIPTYCALADYSNNKTGLCWLRMDTLARRLSRSSRTIQRHLQVLKEKGLVEFVERKRDWRSRFGAYVYRVVHIAAVTARKRAEGVSRKERRRKNAPPPDMGVLWSLLRDKLNDKKIPPTLPKKDYKNGYWWLFGEGAPPGAEEEHRREVEKKQEEEIRHRRRGYEWFSNSVLEVSFSPVKYSQ